MGRYSRYPAINREVSPSEPQEAAYKDEEPEEVVDTTPVVEAAEPVEAPVPDPVEADEAEVAEPEDEAPDDGADPGIDLDEMSVREVMKWVGDDDERRQAALAHEQSGRGRTSLLRKLRGA